MNVWEKTKALLGLSRAIGDGNDPGILDMGFGGPGDSPMRAGSREWLKIYGENSNLQMVGRRIGYDVALLKWYLFQRLPGVVGPQGPPKRQIFEHDFLTLWKKPNEHLVNFHFIYLTQIYLEIDGETHWVLERKPGKLKPDGIWPVPKSWITHRPTAAAPYWKINGVKDHLPAGEVIWLHDPDPLAPYSRGLGVAKSLDDDVAQDEWMNKFNNSFFRNGGHPGMVFGLEGVEPTVAAQIRDGYEKKYTGFWNAFKTAWIGTGARGGKISVHQLGATHKDMDFIEGKKSRRDSILQAWNMQKYEVGVNEDVNRASAQASEHSKSRNVTLPRSVYLQQAVECFLLPLFGDPSLIIEIENPVKQTEEFRLVKATEGLDRGAITVDEWRRENNWDPLPNGEGNVRYVPLNMDQKAVGGRRVALLGELSSIDPEAAEVLQRKWKT